MIKKFFAMIFTLLLICAGVFLTMKLSDTKVQKPDNPGFIVKDNSDVVESITADTPTIEVTKDPRDEIVRAGDTTWFIAHADNDDMIDWVFINPNLAEYESRQIGEAFPNFRVTLLTEDTVELANVPAGLNGWMIKAKFVNEDCTVYSKTATIHVVDYDVRYNDIVEMYRAFCAGDESLRENVSEIAWDNRDLGYSVIDIDHDGIEELVIGTMHPLEATYGGCIVDVYTIVDEENVVRTISGSPRHRYYFMNSGLIYSLGSSGAGMTDCVVSEYYDLELHPVESVWTNITEEDPLGYYYSDNGDRYSEWFEKIPEEYFYSLVGEYENEINYFYPTSSLR